MQRPLGNALRAPTPLFAIGRGSVPAVPFDVGLLYCAEMNRASIIALVVGTTVLLGGPILSASPPQSLDLRGTRLILNGYGEREHWWTNVYRCALYLPRRMTRISTIRDPRTAKAIRIRVLYNDLPKSMPSEWKGVFASELNRELLGHLKRNFRNLQQDDVIVFSYNPEIGSAVWINDERILTDPDHALMLGLIDQWIGARPVSRNLKRLLLGTSN